MNKEQRFVVFVASILIFPFLMWFVALKQLHGIPKNHLFAYIKFAANKTIHFEDIRLLTVYLISLVVVFAVCKFCGLFDDIGFKGREYKKFLRGTKIVSKEKLSNMTKEKNIKQITLSDIPIPTKIEPLHFLFNGSTGSGKSVSLREMVSAAINRGDRLIIVDPNADMFSKFAKKGDVLLNPFDQRTKGWSIYNEIRASFDYRNYCGSIVPKSPDHASEEWNGFARVLLESIMRALKKSDPSATPSMVDVAHWATVAEVQKLKQMLVGTDAESMFVEGSDRALGSARFVLSSRLPIFKEMPQGDFSIRDFLENKEGGNIYITWKEAQKEAIKPLISAWIDILCSSILSLPPSQDRRIWLFLDELASLDHIKSLEDALTKGRKNGLRVVGGIQSISQLRQIYGRDGATILMSCFRSLIVMGGAKTDSETAEEMSKALGEHEVVRDNKNRSTGGGKTSVSRSEQVQRERVILPSEITALPDLTGFVSFAGDYPICRFTSKYKAYETHNDDFVDVALR